MKQAFNRRGVVAEGLKANLLFEPWEVTTTGAGAYKVFIRLLARLPRPAVARRSAACPAQAAGAAASGRRATRSRRGACCRRRPIGRVAWAPPGLRARHPPPCASGDFLDDALARLPARARPADGQGHLAPVAASRLRRDQPAADLAGRHDARPFGGDREVPGRARLARIRLSPAVPSRRSRASATSGRNSTPFPGSTKHDALEAWRRGRTGYPIVDAGMRELWTTGWMHNRVRMIVASFLTKDLLIDWRAGERWFWDTLVDADPANNADGLAMGRRQRRRCRALFPHLQSRAAGREVRSQRRLCAPLGARAGVTAGRDHPPALDGRHAIPPEIYPARIVDHAAARERALQAFRALKRSA